jgi:hypothetical protein
MFEVSVDSIGYRIITDAEAVWQICDNACGTLPHRNCVTFCGSRFRVAYGDRRDIKISSYCSHSFFPPSCIFGAVAVDCAVLQYLAVEIGSELQSINLFPFLSLGESVVLEGPNFLIRSLLLLFILIEIPLSFN